MSNKSAEIRYRHRTWGEGVLKSVQGTILVLEFPQVGEKMLTVDSVSKGILTLITEEKQKDKIANSVLTHNDGALRQYDSSDTTVGGKNILEAFETDDVVLFNESYTIIGDETAARKISATYDLTVIGDISVDEMKVNGDLTVIGDISAKVLICANALICQGHVNVDKLYVGSIVAKSVKCVEFTCDGNAIIETTIDIDESSRTEKTMVACEGIMGAGSFVALNAIANEYFEFAGDVQGNVLELESDATISEVAVPGQAGADSSELSIEDVIRKIEERLQTEYKRCGELDEGSLIEFTQRLSDNSLHTLADYTTLFNELTRISYQDEIDDFGDFLTAVYAKKILPKEIYRYETIEHIDAVMLPKARDMIDDLDFKPRSVERIALCLKMAIECADIIHMSTDFVLDKIFSSFGLRYSTVKSIMAKVSTHAPANTGKSTAKPEPKTVVDNPAAEIAAHMFNIEKPKPQKLNMSRSKFLAMSIHTQAKRFGITDDEQTRLASARVKTCGDFLKMTEKDLREIFRNKLFLANHLYLAQQKMRATVDTMVE